MTIRGQRLDKWAAKFGNAERESFVAFLKDCPEDVSDKLAREPLLLYLLGRMHRDQAISAADLQGTSGVGMKAKIKIYDAVITWVLEKQRDDENLRITGLECDELRQLLTEAALCVVQSGNEIAQVQMLEARLAGDSNNPITRLIEKSRQSADVSEQKALNNLLTTFYIKPAAVDRDGSIEFAHKSFGEYLFAERLKEAIEDWSKSGERRRSSYLVPDDELHWEIYDLLGYGGLTPEITDYLMVMLEDSQEWKPVTLFNRLNDFWERWCDGEFTDAPPENLPQQKMRLLREQMPDQETKLGLRQVDVFTGLNSLILLIGLHRYAQAQTDLKEKIHFYPSGQPTNERSWRLLFLPNEHSWTSRLLQIVHYGDWVYNLGVLVQSLVLPCTVQTSAMSTLLAQSCSSPTSTVPTSAVPTSVAHTSATPTSATPTSATHCSTGQTSTVLTSTAQTSTVQISETHTSAVPTLTVQTSATHTSAA